MGNHKRKKEEMEYWSALFGPSGTPRKDPFPISAPHKVDYWADNKKVLSELIRVERDALIFPSSRIHAFYGPLGGGKSFAISYLADPNTRKVLMKHVSPTGKAKDFLAFSIPASFPLRAGMLTRNVYLGIFRKLFDEIVLDIHLLDGLREMARTTPGTVGQALRSITQSVVRNIEGKISLSTIEETDGYKLLTLERSRLGSLKTQDDYVLAIKAVAEPLLVKYRRVLIAIDELENLRQVSASERLFFNDFVRRLHQEIETGLVIILIFTLQTFGEVESVLQPAVLSRISGQIHFDFVRTRHDIVEYIVQCLEEGADVKASDVMERDAIEAIARDLLKYRKEVTFREVNKELHLIFTSLLTDGKGPVKITKPAYESLRKQVPVEEIMRDLGRRT